MTKLARYALIALTLAGSALHAQVSTASIYGTVRDSSGAAIPGAALTLHNTATGVDLTSSANGAGEYAIVNIQPGAYDLRVTKPGFQSSVQSNVVLSVNQTATYDLTLNVGSSEQ